ncbi:lipase 3-like [Diprion similis]|uniref:lipase 3-like n=1 Tax=Diprion similis TaxID=362088 RepID=UPI001EF89FE0|nr:lipase 3-like [Diprion similis]
MKLQLILVVALVGSAIADDDAEKVWTEDEVEALMATATSDVNATVPELIAQNGYTAEIHYVTTEDGYILQMHRIPATPTSPASDDKPVVFLMHGTVCSSADFVIMGPGKGFAYILADAGYDVWLGNARGNKYSRNHTTLTNFTGPDFWYFDWHEIGYYDQPAMIDYALEVTGQEKVIFIGHSQGTTTFYVMASLRPEYNDKIKVMFSLAPVAYMTNLKSPVLQFAAKFESYLTDLFELIGEYEFFPNGDFVTEIGSTYCDDDALTQYLCSNALFLLVGFDKANLNITMLPTIFGHTPAGASTRQIVHYAQEVRSGKFGYYDQDMISNLYKYGSIEAPNYNLSAITAPVHVIYGANDYMSAVEDVEKHYTELGNPIEMYRVPDENWNHVDYLWGITAKELVYDHVISTIEANYSD